MWVYYKAPKHLHATSCLTVDSSTVLSTNRPFVHKLVRAAQPQRVREFFIDNLLVRTHFIIVQPHPQMPNGA